MESKTKIVTVLVLISLAFYVNAKEIEQDGVFLSLDEAIKLALSKNTAIEFAGLDRVLEKFAIRKAENEFYPQYTLSLSSRILSKNNTTESGKSIKPNLGVNPGITLKSNFGTSVGVSFPQNITNTGKQVRTVIRVSQPLLRGFGREVNLTSLRNTYDQEIINKLKFRNTVSKSIVGVVKKYRTLIASNYRIKANMRSLEDSRKGVEFTKAKIKAGKSASTDLVQSQAQLESLQLSVLQQENSANFSKQDLLIDIGLDPETKIFVPDDIEVTFNKLPDLEEAIALALANNYEYRSQLNNLVSTKRRLNTTRNNMLWDLSIEYNAGFGGGDFDGLSSGENFNHALSATLKIPINDYSLKESLIAANIAVKKGETNIAEAKRSLISNVKKQLFDLDNLQRQIGFARRSLELAEKSYEVENKKLDLGKTSGLQVSTAQDKVLKAEADLISAKISFENSLDDLHVILGTALDKWGIELEF